MHSEKDFKCQHREMFYDYNIRSNKRHISLILTLVTCHVMAVKSNLSLLHRSPHINLPLCKSLV